MNARSDGGEERSPAEREKEARRAYRERNAERVRAGDALALGPTTIHPRLVELEAAGLVIADPPMTDGQPRGGVWVRYRVDNEAVTDLYLRLGAAIGEF
ncbi:MAG: hypothetical protein ACTHNQ_15635 [Microbacterium sp.]|uniref:hypothetical protein n=1 Tax=Microbacterium sp. TaxID=51671 RepID=UPI003F7E28E4